MTEKNAGSDSWGQLLSDFGLEDEKRESVPQQSAPQQSAPQPDIIKAGNPSEPTGLSAWKPKTLEEPADLEEFGAGLGDSNAETSDELSTPKEKKSIFSRFPKINFFGVPPEASLDSVIGGLRSPSLGGKAFTDNKLEKMPVSQERTERQQRLQQEQEASAVHNVRSAVASQIDVLASEERPSKRVVSSMFDDPIPEPEELRRCKDLMEEQPSRRKKHAEAFLEEDSDYQRGYRGSRSEEKEVSNRGSRYRKPLEVDDLPESDFEPMDEEIPPTRGRGGRGSRYSGGGYRGREQIQEERPREEWSEVDAALQAESGRGGRRQYSDTQPPGRRRRQERVEESRLDRNTSDENDSGFVAIHGNIPSWDEAVREIISGNIARHKSHSGGGRSGRGRR